MICKHCGSHVNIHDKSINKEGKTIYRCPFCNGVAEETSVNSTHKNTSSNTSMNFYKSSYGKVVRRYDNSMKIASLVMIIIALAFLILIPTVEVFKKDYTMYELGNAQITMVTFCFIIALCFHVNDLVRSDAGASDVVNIILMIISFFSYIAADVLTTYNGGEFSVIFLIVPFCIVFSFIFSIISLRN